MSGSIVHEKPTYLGPMRQNSGSSKYINLKILFNFELFILFRW
jgi:hypothetical protein